MAFQWIFHEVLEDLMYGTLTKVDLSGTYEKRGDMGDSEAEELAYALKGNKSVVEVDLSWNEIGTEGAQALADAFKVNTTVHTIYLSANRIGAEGARALVDALKVNTTVHTFDLSWNEIGAEGARALVDALKVNTTVHTIDLSGNEIGKEGAQALADALKVNTTVHTIYLNGNTISDDDQNKIDDILRAHWPSQVLNVMKCSGDKTVFDRFLQPNVDTINMLSSGETLLGCAVQRFMENSQDEMATKIIELGSVQLVGAKAKPTPFIAACATGALGADHLAAMDIDAMHVNTQFKCVDGKERTPLDVAIDMQRPAMVVSLAQLGAVRVVFHTPHDVTRLLGRCHASMMIVGRFQSGKTLMSRYLVEFKRMIRFLGVKVRHGSRPESQECDESVKSGNDHRATPGFDVRDFIVKMAPDNASGSAPSSPAMSKRGKRSSGVSNSLSIEVNASMFDFGGQNEYRFYHPIFFSPRTLYIIVFNMKRLVVIERDDDGNVLDKPLRCDEARSAVRRECMEWLYSIRPLGWHVGHTMDNEKMDEGDAPRVYVVGTHWDEIKADQRDQVRVACNDLLNVLSRACMEECTECKTQRRVAHILNDREDVTNKDMNANGVYKLALSENATKSQQKDVERLRQRLVALALGDPRRPLLPLEGARNAVADALDRELAGVKQASTQLAIGGQQEGHLPIDLVVRSVESFGVEVMDPLFKRTCAFYKEKGAIFYFVPRHHTFAESARYLILSPNWLSKCLAILVNVATGKDRRGAEYFVDGSLHVADVQDVWQSFMGDEADNEKVQYFMDLLSHVGVCTQLPDRPHLYMFPTLVQEEWSADEQSRYKHSEQQISWRFSSRTASERFLLQATYEFVHLCRSQKHANGIKFFLDRYRHALVLQCDPDFASAVFVVLDSVNVRLSFTKDARPFVRCDDGAARIVEDSLGWAVIQVLRGLLEDQRTVDADDTVDADNANDATTTTTTTAVKHAGVAACTCQSNTIRVSCPMCAQSEEEPFEFSFTNMGDFVHCLNTGLLPRTSGRDDRPLRCPKKHMITNMCDLLLESHRVARAPQSNIAPKVEPGQRQKRKSMYLQRTQTLMLVGGSHSAVLFKERLQHLLQNLFDLCHGVFKGTQSSAKHNVDLFNASVSLLELLRVNDAEDGSIEPSAACIGEQSLQQADTLASCVAERITTVYCEQLRRLTDDDTMDSAYVLKDGRDRRVPFAHVLADYAFLSCLHVLRRVDMNTLPAVGALEGVFVSGVIASDADSTLLLPNATIDRYVVLGTNNAGDVVEWLLRDVFARPGIRTPNHCFYSGASCDVAAYGYRLGSETEAQAKGLSLDARVEDAVSAEDWETTLADVSIGSSNALLALPLLDEEARVLGGAQPAYELFSLPPSSSSYRSVRDLFDSLCGARRVEIDSIRQVVNRSLFHKFAQRRTALAQLQTDAAKAQLLVHYTAPNVVELITQHGMSAKHASGRAWFGKGLYFSPSAAYGGDVTGHFAEYAREVTEYWVDGACRAHVVLQRKWKRAKIGPITRKKGVLVEERTYHSGDQTIVLGEKEHVEMSSNQRQLKVGHRTLLTASGVRGIETRSYIDALLCVVITGRQRVIDERHDKLAERGDFYCDEECKRACGGEHESHRVSSLGAEVCVGVASDTHSEAEAQVLPRYIVRFWPYDVQTHIDETKKRE